MMIVEAADSYLNNSKCVTGSVIKQTAGPQLSLTFPYADLFVLSVTAAARAEVGRRR